MAVKLAFEVNFDCEKWKLNKPLKLILTVKYDG